MCWPCSLDVPIWLPRVVHVQAGSGSDGDSEGHDLRRIRPSPVDSSSMRVVGTTGWQAPELLHESLLRSSGSLPQGEDGFTLVDGPPSGARCVCVRARVCGWCRRPPPMCRAALMCRVILCVWARIDWGVRLTISSCVCACVFVCVRVCVGQRC